MKPQIRLPSDHGPNPYDSKTPFQKPLWMQPQWLVGVLLLGTLFGVMAWFKANPNYLL